MKKKYYISADNGNTWTIQFLTDEEVQIEYDLGHTVKVVVEGLKDV